MKPHVLCIGGEDHRLRIPFILALRERGFAVTAAGSGDPAPFAAQGIDCRRFEFRRFANPFADLSSITAMSRLLANVRPDIVQTFDTKPNLLVPMAAGNKFSRRVVRTINGMGWLFSSRSLPALGLRPLYRGLHQVAARFTAATVFQNRRDQEYFEAHGMVGRSLSRLIPGSGIDVAAFETAQRAGPSPDTRRRLEELGDADIVLTVTRITRQKGIQTLFQAAELVHKIRPDVRFVLVGPRQSEGVFAVSQQEIDSHFPYVVYLGPREDVPAILARADLFAFPTEYREGVPRVLLEAGLAGVPIVTTDMPGCTDVVTDGWNGHLVPPRDPVQLACRVLDMLRDKACARAMGSRSIDLIRGNFDLGRTVDRYVALYEDVLRTDLARSLSSGEAGQHQPQPVAAVHGARTIAGLVRMDATTSKGPEL